MKTDTSSFTDYDQIADAVWVKLARAAADPADRLRLMAVATVNPEHRPSNRLLILRGADRERGFIWFHTDRRSPKMHHLRASPYVSILAYDDQDHVQIRLDGAVSVHQHDGIAQQHWEQTSMTVRYAYAVSPSPGMKIESTSTHRGTDSDAERPHTPDPRTEVMRHQHLRGDLAAGRQNFAVLQVHVEVIDWLQVCEYGQRRAMLRADKNWTAVPLSP